MDNKKSKKLIVITGPTASGKTQMAIDVAKKFNTEIVSFDSRQFFMEISIGTAKPTPAQLEMVPHHFIGHISIHREYNAGEFENDAIHLLNQLFDKHEYVVATGGSGMYLDAILDGFDSLPEVKEGVRDQLIQLHQKEGIAVLQTMLAENDPEHYNNVDLNNPHRLIRALEIILSTGSTYSSLRKGKKKSRIFSSHLFGIDMTREALYDRINKRVLEMISNGLVEEVKSMIPHRNLNALQTVGYKEIFSYLDGKLKMEEATDLIQQNSRHFAKRQLTWFRKYDQLTWVSPENSQEFIVKSVK